MVLTAQGQKKSKQDNVYMAMLSGLVILHIKDYQKLCAVKFYFEKGTSFITFSNQIRN